MCDTLEEKNKKPLIVVADDDESILLLISSTLEREGYQVESFKNGEEVLAFCQDESPALVILDAIMPKVDGFNVARQLLSSYSGFNAPIIIITSLNDDESVDKAFKSGATDFVSKPIHWPVLLYRVRRLLATKELAHALDEERCRAELEKERFECRLRQAHKMEAIGRLAGGVAHDFNNILTAIVGYVDLTAGVAAKYNDEKITKYLKEIARASDRARGLIRQMLDYSRQGGRKMEVVEVKGLIFEVVSLLKSMLPSSVRIDIKDCDEDLYIVVDPVQLHQVIMNLCINARDAMEGKGEIVISVGKERVEDVECSSCYKHIEGELACIAITDSGIGISEQVLNKIFDPFFTTKDVGQGTGMGLSVVHGIVHHFDGHVCVASKAQNGTTFRIYFPLVERYKN